MKHINRSINKKRKFEEPQSEQSSAEENWSASEEEVNENEGDHSDGEDSSEEEGEKKSEEDFQIDPSVPLYKLLQQVKTKAADKPNNSSLSQKTKRIKIEKEKTDGESKIKEKKSKHAPAEMRSDRPVRRLRVNADNYVRKFVDPRFADYTGSLDQRIFAKNFDFLDDKRENEIKQLSRTIQKTKNTSLKEEMKKELYKMKQQHHERQLSLKVMEKVDSMKKKEKELIKEGKRPFFLKNSEKKNIMAEERYALLKKQGKLQKFMNKKRKKNASRDRAKIPERRGSFDE